MKNYTQKYVRMTNGEISLKVPREEVNEYLSSGYELGWVTSSSRVWVNNGTTEKCVLIKYLPKYLEKGFSKGKIGSYVSY